LAHLGVLSRDPQLQCESGEPAMTYGTGWARTRRSARNSRRCWSRSKHPMRKLKRAQILLPAGGGDVAIASNISVCGSTVYEIK
jgi:hypothetical protein